MAGERSVARRLLRCAASLLSDGPAVRALNAADTAAQIQAAMRRFGPSYPELQRLADVVAQHVSTPQVCTRLSVKPVTRIKPTPIEYTARVSVQIITLSPVCHSTLRPLLYTGLKLYSTHQMNHLLAVLHVNRPIVGIIANTGITELLFTYA